MELQLGCEQKMKIRPWADGMITAGRVGGGGRAGGTDVRAKWPPFSALPSI